MYEALLTESSNTFSPFSAKRKRPCVILVLYTIETVIDIIFAILFSKFMNDPKHNGGDGICSFEMLKYSKVALAFHIAVAVTVGMFIMTVVMIITDKEMENTLAGYFDLCRFTGCFFGLYIFIRLAIAYSNGGKKCGDLGNLVLVKIIIIGIVILLLILMLLFSLVKACLKRKVQRP